jgi:chromosome segregation protein
MQDVIFAGGRGVQPRTAAEVEIVLDNEDGEAEVPLSEISIVRRLDRNGEGGYTLNGARCRLADVLEVLSDTGLGKETHSVISQGRVDAIVTPKPRERRLLIEEAAGLGKHRKRRRRAQLKLERTRENVDRVLDIEREARLRLRPLKRQAEAAQLHERLERQLLHARRELVTDSVRARREELGQAESLAARARERLQATESELQSTRQARVQRGSPMRRPSAEGFRGVWRESAAAERLRARASGRPAPPGVGRGERAALGASRAGRRGRRPRGPPAATERIAALQSESRRSTPSASRASRASSASQRRARARAR